MKVEIKRRIEAINRGEVPKGYKTQFGTSPETWKRYRLNEICEKVTKKNHKNQIKTVLTNSAIDGVMLQSKYFEKSIANEENTENYFIVENKDFIYNPRISSNAAYGPINPNELNVKGIVSPLYTVFRQTDTKNVLYEYLKYFFSSSQWHEYIYSIGNYGVRFDRINILDEDFFNMPVIVPPMTEQKRIVENISHCDKVITLKENLLTEKRRLKKWLLENLLNPDGGVRLPGFKGKWEEAKIENLFSFGSSFSASRSQLSDNGFCYLHYGDIHANENYYVDVDNDYEKIPKLAVAKIDKKYLLNDGDIAFVDASEDYDGVSKFVVVKNINNHPFISGLHTIPLRAIDKRLHANFKIYCFQSSFVKNQMRFLANGMKVFGLSKTSLAKVKAKYPCLKEQEAIADILFQMDNEINLLDKDIVEWCIIKKALMQVLLTGIVRR